MYKHGDLCPVCGYEGIEKKTIVETFKYKGKTKELKNYVVFECPDCGESFVDKKTMKKAEKILRDFHREVDGLLTSADIKRIRTSLGFTQKNFGLILGGGEKAFTKYESGTVTQSKPMDNLIRLLDKRPDLIELLPGTHSSKTDFSEPMKYHYYEENKQIFRIVGE